ncbi:hypothetical protein MJG53_007898 [Ovis ammon polii x Ovis aries]|uniref:Uncharacterized protein n=1 Tax=Ovis ammon polii x Ovis aries TaxID=2918886 RepID=A0ACB9V4T8_9CETA|nr:hypothetical protein MJG53_007898 [Ovis ammon polii x Ovis aries]
MGLKRTLRRHMRGSQRSASLLRGPPWTREPYRELVCAVGGLQLGMAVAARAKGHACETTESFVPATRDALQLDSLDQKQEQKLFDTVLLLRKSLIVSDAKQVLHECLLNSMEPAAGRSHSPQAEGGGGDRKGENTGGLGSQRQIQKQSQAPLTCESGPSHLSRQPLLHLVRPQNTGVTVCIKVFGILIYFERAPSAPSAVLPLRPLERNSGISLSRCVSEAAIVLPQVGDSTAGNRQLISLTAPESVTQGKCHSWEETPENVVPQAPTTHSEGQSLSAVFLGLPRSARTEGPCSCCAGGGRQQRSEAGLPLPGLWTAFGSRANLTELPLVRCVFSPVPASDTAHGRMEEMG